MTEPLYIFGTYRRSIFDAVVEILMDYSLNVENTTHMSSDGKRIFYQLRILDAPKAIIDEIRLRIGDIGVPVFMRKFKGGK